jgi:hypothetical protein
MRLFFLLGILSGFTLALPAHKELQRAFNELKFGEWKYCGDAETDAYTIKNVFVSQYMGIASVHVFGHVNREITKGARLLSALTMGKWPISVNEVDFCEFLKKEQPGAPQCPLKAGNLDMTINLSIPPNMPPSNYELHSIIRDAHESPISCLQGGFAIPGM